ncbi:hypothetical protein GF336_03625 [Candidatus Woesearchaeota archaeon]|nr:hypothetical protein [Candidatus Woesearchaeota archaeon]
MEVQFDELVKIIDEISLTDRSRIQYRDRTYFIELDGRSGPEAEFFASGTYSGADIYIWNQVRPEFKRPMILHEVIEADLYLHQRIPKRDAHMTAMEHDRNYAKATLDTQTLLEYEQFRESINEFFGGN